jgi:DNA-binding GntR family transcriptional regulator
MSTTISESICHQLVDDIITGKIPPGQKLEEQSIAERFDVSRTPVRDAFRQLASTGLAISRPRRGVTVADLQVDQISDMYEGLGELEALCARFSAQRMSVLERKRLEEIHEDSRADVIAKNLEDYSEHNERFHRAIYAGSHNETLFELAMTLRRKLAPFRRPVFFRGAERIEKSFDEHQLIVEAILASDDEAAFQAIRSHVANSSINVISYVEESTSSS